MNVAGITLPPAKPSSTTSTKRTFGVKIELTRDVVDVFDRLGILGDVLHGLEERLVEHVAALVHHRDQDAVGAAEVLLVVQEGLHVFVLQRNLLLEAGVDAAAARRRTPSPR